MIELYLMAASLFLLGFLVMVVPKYIKFVNSKYKFSSGNGFLKTVLDIGNYGEFLTFTVLEKLGNNQKLLTNLYIPKEDGTTTEIDLVLISNTGIYVIESKNYSGWIFGDEKNKNWTQSLPNKRKNQFFNPVWQNSAHINALKNVLEFKNDDFYKSYIVFSERCTLKKINVSSKIKVIKRDSFLKSIKSDIECSSKLLSEPEVDKLYNFLQKFSLASDNIKKNHINRLKVKA
ncbi:MAG: hypothetical protein K0S51_2149 [Bacillales bacterium]|jgi:hypothetical protein|nr:hypothetical protein [Bacillales bacterium]